MFIRPLLLGSALGEAIRPFREAAVAQVFRGQTRGLLWSVEKEKDHKYRDTREIIDEDAINRYLISKK